MILSFYLHAVFLSLPLVPIFQSLFLSLPQICSACLSVSVPTSGPSAYFLPSMFQVLRVSPALSDRPFPGLAPAHPQALWEDVLSGGQITLVLPVQTTRFPSTLLCPRAGVASFWVLTGPRDS